MLRVTRILLAALIPVASLPAGVPSASGTREWTRVANVNNLACE